jgi:BirA family transcriptional regulator, biotin operon repressor / biotin---[acetyl-CoA-carboxylase] ligase
MVLDAIAVAAGVRLVAHPLLASTNAEALRLAALGERGPLWIVAERQTAGRGRRGRIWSSPAGNLHTTLLLSDPATAGARPQLSFVAALALVDAVASLVPSLAAQLAIKWPNDLLLSGRKVAGILLEGVGDAVAVGIGVNCASHPSETEYPATDLATADAAVSSADLLAALSRTMVARLALWGRGAGFAAIRADWLAHATGLGGEIRVRLGARELSGRFEALDEAGALVLRRVGGDMITIAAGDVFLASAPNPKFAHTVPRTRPRTSGSKGH